MATNEGLRPLCICGPSPIRKYTTEISERTNSYHTASLNHRRGLGRPRHGGRAWGPYLLDHTHDLLRHFGSVTTGFLPVRQLGIE